MKTRIGVPRIRRPKTPALFPRVGGATGIGLLVSLMLIEEVRAQDFGYTTNNGIITITLYQGPGGVISVPSTINGLPVTGIGDSAFADSSTLTGVTIPSSVTDIGNLAFSNCSSLTSIGVDVLNPSYSSLDGVLFDKTQTKLIQYPGAKAGSYSVPKSITCIAEAALADSTALTNVMIPDSVTNIGTGAFSSCLLMNAIAVDPLNLVYSSVNGALFNKDQTKLIQCPAGKAGVYYVPNSVTSIGDGAFGSCAKLTGIAIPSSVTSIGDAAFANCTGLLGLAIPKGVSIIGDRAFFSCTSMFSFSIPDNITSIGTSAFAYCYGLTGLAIPNSVTNVGSEACQRSLKLTRLGSKW